MQHTTVPTRTLIEAVQHSLRNAAEATLTGAYLSRDAQQGHAGHIAQLLNKAGCAATAAKGRLASCPMFHTDAASLALDHDGAFRLALNSGKQFRVSLKQAAALLALWSHRGNGFRFAQV